MHLTLTVYFPTLDQYHEFMRHIEGEGGGQHFVRYCQQKMDTVNHRLTLTGEDVEKWFRYRNEYGSGGFQSRLGRGPQQDSLL